MHYLWKLFEGAKKNGKEELLPKARAQTWEQELKDFVPYSCGETASPVESCLSNQQPHERKGVCVGGGWYFYLLGFCFFLSCRVKTFKPVFIPSCFWHASFAIILDPITPTSSSSSSSSSIPDWIPLESTPLGSSYETHLCSLWPHMTRFSWPPRRADADGTSTL